MHHLGHHQTYTDKLNVALNELRGNDTTKYLAKLGIDKLLQRLDEVPESLRTSIRNKCVSLASRRTQQPNRRRNLT